MDISGLNSAYLEQYQKLASENTSLGGQMKTDYSKADKKELMDACKQFEAYFLEQVFKEMSKTVKLTDDSSNSNLVDFFKDKTIQQIASDSTEQNSLGLAQMLYEQMARNYGVAEDSVKDIE